MSGSRYEFSSVLRRWEARTEKWVFADLPEDVSDAVADEPHEPAGFGAVKVDVTLGSSRWSTSVFPGASGYVLPVKAVVRRREGVDVGDTVRIGIETLT